MHEVIKQPVQDRTQRVKYTVNIVVICTYQHLNELEETMAKLQTEFQIAVITPILGT